ncbi:Hypothetical protein PHPALM_9614 [Phytophthora palmivora]|uniref:Uncharacterized protein n=1 Tax=Phytophthora palmivora TaxID=4796 RepID=A0A2P4Y6U5_9STRA|nr:Hypothetical protein PHPALM_9614 [Phytophthora palmivora]
MKEDDRGGELLALCYRGQWPKATELLHDEKLTEVLLFLLENSPRELVKLNTSMQKDGKTLLHLALENNNLVRLIVLSAGVWQIINATIQRFIYELLSAGADVTVADKKGVKPMDLMSWTSVVHPTMMVPLQDSILHLQHRNELRQAHTSALNQTTDLLLFDERNLLAHTHEIEKDVAAAQAFRAEVGEQIRRAQVTDRELTTSIEAEEVKLQWIRGEVARLHTQNGTADQEVAQINEETEQLVAATTTLRAKHDIQRQGRHNVAAQRAVKCEMIGMLRQFPGNEALQTRALRALMLTSTENNEVVKWRTEELVGALMTSCTSIKIDSLAVSDQVYRTTSAVYDCLKMTPHLNDVGNFSEKATTF